MTIQTKNSPGMTKRTIPKPSTASIDATSRTTKSSTLTIHPVSALGMATDTGIGNGRTWILMTRAGDGHNDGWLH